MAFLGGIKFTLNYINLANRLEILNKMENVS